MRPRGEVRQALAAAVERLYPEHGAVSAREVAAAAQVGYEAARYTLRHMAASAEPEVAVVGHGKGPGTRWHTLYEPRVVCVPDDDDAADTPQPWGGIEALASVMRTFPAVEQAPDNEP